jgi:hypothetical protein
MIVVRATLALIASNEDIFDEFGRLKYHASNPLDNKLRQSRRIQYLWRFGFFNNSSALRNFASLHRQRANALAAFSPDAW